MSRYFIGLMSGTSLDGVDAVLADFSTADQPNAQPFPRILGHAFASFPSALREELLALQIPDGQNELARSQLAANQLVQLYTRVVNDLLRQTRITAGQIEALGVHGQTIRHQPELGYSIQLNNPALLAELTGIPVIAEFRSRDIAAGGQGAPLVPAFHAAVLQHPEQTRAILNIGGMSNLSLLPAAALQPDAPILGFDCGPGNVLLDTWIQHHQNKPFDLDGEWAASGEYLPALLEWLMHEPYFSQQPPKSTGRDLFNLVWLEEQIALACATPPAPQDVQATLMMLTVQSIAQDLRRHAPHCQLVLVCGGGARNPVLMRQLAKALPHLAWHTTDEFGIPAQSMEALAFAWLAWRHQEKQPGNLPAVTGAKGLRTLGAYYPA
ncbi:anhydro-N-acetylmuramic acid kinase [Parvibium lacunae]|uniref:Anhydro-N-acetylmuramic acid kinase n=1 Tax=Parvibium lacunae TaxID=1888893 RepID=A0A368KZP8_9BURK|nr:anhydro-N-acetylmuramic acid kinase [Parvibium lacunae]RCS56773.1 anhydro-N-acetylmuramic acid kinase [Parvibium lacunae]